MNNENIRIGCIAKTRMGRNEIEVEILAIEGSSYKVRSLNTGREFYTNRLELTNHPINEEIIMTEENIINTPIAEPDESATNPAPESGKSNRKRSLFEAAVEVLKQSENPMNTKDIVAKAIELGLWEPTNAKTPEQTLYSAIFREIATKERPRIVKSEQKGKFQYNG